MHFKRSYIAGGILVSVFGLIAALMFGTVYGAAVTPGGHISHVFHFLKNSVGSYNWAGYVVATSQAALDNPDTASYESLAAPIVTEAHGSWIVQAVNGSGTNYSAQWVGIGGYFGNDSTLIQTGTSSDTSSNKASYNAWYELLPSTEVAINMTVAPGDNMNASIVCLASCANATQTWRITLTDTSTGQYFTKVVSYSSKMLTAEWIDERPEICRGPKCSLTSLAYFNQAYYGLDYSGIAGTEYATFNALPEALASVPYESVTMFNANGAALATPSAPTTDQTSFSVAYGSGVTQSTSTTTVPTTTTAPTTTTVFTTTIVNTTSTTTVCPRYNPHGKCVG